MSDSHHSSLGIHSAGPPHAGTGAAPRARLLMRARRATVLIVVLLALGAAGTVIGRVVRMRDLQATTQLQARNFVLTTQIQPSKGGETLALPGTLQGFIESPIYARTSGYLLRWYRDIGARVQKGDLLAELDTPEVDQQLAQATASREQAAASLELAKSSAERWESLRLRDAVSQQELDERRSAFSQAQANLAAAEANVRRLTELEGFKRIVAPFSGVVTRRNIDVGDLVDAGNGGVSRALFTLAQTDPLRLYVYVPQSYANLVRIGETISVTQAEMPSVRFRGTVSRTAGAIDTLTRTLQVEVSLPNHDERLLPGAYVQLQLPVGKSASLVAPSNCLLFRPEGPRVAAVDSEGRVRLQPVTIGTDYGQSVELRSGVQIGDVLILNPADSLADGDVVSFPPRGQEQDKK
ncbi:MAG TPA: efflux RND transporter periplasmic adaptor subunit [Burkholderiaceae bacterium]|nr:efflux RND transporter periplasmic adaptor subunit [Burkholderiaceae bacterium]